VPADPASPERFDLIQWGRELNELSPKERGDTRARAIARAEQDSNLREVCALIVHALDCLSAGMDMERYFIGAAIRNQKGKT
jgi:hypothetical protein